MTGILIRQQLSIRQSLNVTHLAKFWSDELRGLSSTSVISQKRVYKDVKKESRKEMRHGILSMASSVWGLMRPQTPDREEKASLAGGRGRTMQPCFRCEYFLNKLICCQPLRAKRQETGMRKRCGRESLGWFFSACRWTSCNLNLRFIFKSDLSLPFWEGMWGCMRLKEWRIAIAFIYLCESCKGSFKTPHENKINHRRVIVVCEVKEDLKGQAIKKTIIHPYVIPNQ